MPYKFIRNIDEGGHTKDIEIDFNQKNKKLMFTIKSIIQKNCCHQTNVQDMVSAFYYLRNNYDTKRLKLGMK